MTKKKAPWLPPYARRIDFQRVGRVEPWVPLGLMLALTAFLVILTTTQTLQSYRDLRSGWSWDLAYYNQWFWGVIHGQDLTVRPIGPWTQEGPSVWQMNYLTPIRLAMVPLYAMFPGPQTLLVFQVAVFWMVVPAAYGLVRSESKSSVLALSAAILVAMTPLLWPLAWNDFRELQLAPPFVLWGLHGVRSRDLRLTILGVGGLLACRQEFAILVASLAILPPRERDDVGRRYRWAFALFMTGLGWLLLGFLMYSRWMVNPRAVEVFLGEMTGPRIPLRMTLGTAAEFLVVGLGSWTVLACFAPRVAVLAVPWILSLAGGRWTLRLIGSEQWHHVRYAVPMVSLMIGAGCIGYARIGVWLAHRRAGSVGLAGIWLLSALGLVAVGAKLESWLADIPRPISRDEARQLWGWIERAGPDDGVLAHYEITAPLSSRRILYSYVMRQNTPPGYPALDPSFGWVFCLADDFDAGALGSQGFELVHDGPHIRVFRREVPPGASDAFLAGIGGVDKRTRRTDRPALRSASSIQASDQPTVYSEAAYYWLGYAVLLLTNVGWMAGALLPGLAVSYWARRRIVWQETAAPANSGPSGQEVVDAMHRSEGFVTPPVLISTGPFATYFDRETRSLRLSARVAAGRSPADRASAALEAAHSLGFLRGSHDSRLRDALVFASKLGWAAGWLMMAAGLTLGSWLLLHGGAALVSLSVILPGPLLWFVERRAVAQATRSLTFAGHLTPADLEATRSDLDRLAWRLLSHRAPWDRRRSDLV